MTRPIYEPRPSDAQAAKRRVRGKSRIA